MYRLFLPFFLFLFTFNFAQFVTYNFDKTLIYKDDSGYKNTFYYNSEDVSQMAYILSQSPNEKVPSVFVEVLHKGKVYDVQGEVLFDTYYDLTGYSHRDRIFQSGGKNFQKSDVLWEVKPYKDCVMIETKTEDKENLQLFFINRNDGQDYSGITNAILKIYSLPEIANFPQLLGKGWVLVYGLTDGKWFNNFTGTLVENVKDEKFSLKFSRAQIEELDAPDESLEIPGLYPSYCDVTSPSEDVDEHTGTLIYQFFQGACLKYKYFGLYDLDWYKRYYVKEMEKDVKWAKEEKLLNQKQIEIFKREILSYEYLNNKEKMIE